MWGTRALLVWAGSLILAAPPALAQKSQETLRLAIVDPFPVLSPYNHSVHEAVNFYREVYERLLDYDERKRAFVPSLAKSWTRTNTTTVEFELRDDKVFHSGNKFDADHVVTLVDYIRDPKSQIRSKQRYSWVKNIEKLGPYKIRIEADAPNALDIGYITYMFAMFDGKALQSLENKELYGKQTPYGTGPYKVVELDTNRGVTVERFENYTGDRKNPRAIKRIKGIPIPDQQTRYAQLLTGGIDMIRGIAPDQAADLSTNPKFKITNKPSSDILLLGLDGTGRAGSKPLDDPRVRRAIWMSIDRDLLIKHLIPGGEVAEKMKGMCFPEHTVACSITTPVPPYDPDGAKRLLAEAGYPNGFDLKYDVFIANKQIGEAIAGDLLKVGIRAAVEPVTMSVYIQRRAKGQQQAYTISYPTQLFPDAGSILENYFYGTSDSAGDKLIHKAIEAGQLEFDLEKRAKIYEAAFNRNNEMGYTFAISSMPTVYAHTNDIGIDDNPLSRAGNTIGDYFWK